jgi:dihydropteroate synthase
VERGAHVVRVHDVKETLAALKVRGAMLSMATNNNREHNA